MTMCIFQESLVHSRYAAMMTHIALNAIAITKRTREAAEGLIFFFTAFLVFASRTEAVAGAAIYAAKINTKDIVIKIMSSQLPVVASPPT